MTTYTTIPNTDIDQDSPVTQPLMTALRDNPLAIAEADPSVADSLLPIVSLGTLTMTSGTTQTLSSLVLTPYKELHIFWDNVSHGSGSSQTFSLGGTTVSTSVSGAASMHGCQIIDLSTGAGISIIGDGGASGHVVALNTAITTATTSISISVSAGPFDGGTVKFYGAK